MRNLSLRPIALSLLIGLVSTGPVFAAGQITFVSQGGSYQEAQDQGHSRSRREAAWDYGQPGQHP